MALNPIAEEVQFRINKRFQQLVFTDQGTPKPHVCISCDELLNPKDVKRITIDTLKRCSGLLHKNNADGMMDALSILPVTR